MVLVGNGQCWEWTIGSFRRPRFKHGLAAGTVIKGLLGMDTWKPLASSNYSWFGDGYSSKGNVRNGNLEAFGVLDLIMVWRRVKQ